MNDYYVYILTSRGRRVLYIGVTNDLNKRMVEHFDAKDSKSFTARYNVCKLLYFETFHDINQAIEREKQLKGWTKMRKIELIRQVNPNFLYLLPDGRVEEENL